MFTWCGNISREEKRNHFQSSYRSETHGFPRWTFDVRGPNVEWSIHRKMSLWLLDFVFRWVRSFIPRRYPKKGLNVSILSEAKIEWSEWHFPMDRILRAPIQRLFSLPDQETSPGAPSPFDRDHINKIGHGEFYQSLEEFGWLSIYCWEIEFWLATLHRSRS